MHGTATRFCCIFMMALSIMWTSVGTRLLGYTANVFSNAFLKGLDVTTHSGHV